MFPKLQTILFQLRSRFFDERGQDLVEYALVVAMISLGAVAGMRTVAADISASFTHVATTFNSYI